MLTLTICALPLLAAIVRAIRTAPLLHDCAVCGEPCRVGLCRCCERPLAPHERRRLGPHLFAAQLYRTLDARTAARGDDGYVRVAVPVRVVNVRDGGQS